MGYRQVIGLFQSLKGVALAGRGAPAEGGRSGWGRVRPQKVIVGLAGLWV